MGYSLKLHMIVLLGLFTLILSCKDTTGPDEPKVKKIVLSSPKGGDIYHPGDTINIAWEYQNYNDTDVTTFMTFTDLSLDGGLNFVPIIYKSVIHKTLAADTFWVVPDDSTYFSDDARIHTYHYQEITIATMSGNFTIQGSEKAPGM